ncbi:MAG TPA: dihydrofolate reductase family protein [Egicoccus sp.]|nr:dihydrofolate reductase family protein [Egicoccus sp.]HSK24808.1 dihydrofolate reductase family protein [Egicoccus sp.]
MRLTLTHFVTLDGVQQGPGAPDEDTTGGFDRGGWMVPHMDQAFVDLAAGWLEAADGLLLGRRTYEEFAAAWPANDDPDDPFAARMNALPKYVASRTITETPWSPVTVLDGDVAARVRELKERPGRELQVHGSARLARALLAAGLVDAVRLVVAPTVLGKGRRLFADDGPALGMRVTGSTTTPGGLTVLVLESVGSARTAAYDGVGSVGAGAPGSDPPSA